MLKRATNAPFGRTIRYNLVLLAAAVTGLLIVWTAVGELLGDVYQADGDGLFVHVVSFVLSTAYLGFIFCVLFTPGLALFLFIARKLRHHSLFLDEHRRTLALLLSPLIAVVFFIVPAVPEDHEGVFSGWWFILGTAVTVALLARLPQPKAPHRSDSAQVANSSGSTSW